MNLEEVKYRKCCCGVFFPLAHWEVNNYAQLKVKKKKDNFIEHNNEQCISCLRKALKKLSSQGILTRHERKRIKQIKGMLPKQYGQKKGQKTGG